MGMRRDTRDGAQVGAGCKSLFFFIFPEGGEERLAVVLSKKVSRVVRSSSSDERVIDKVLLQF